jgi:hypothetical protein
VWIRTLSIFNSTGSKGTIYLLSGERPEAPHPHKIGFLRAVGSLAEPKGFVHLFFERFPFIPAFLTHEFALSIILLNPSDDCQLDSELMAMFSFINFSSTSKGLWDFGVKPSNFD